MKSNDTSKIAFVFPGQGSQFVGMGRALFEASPRAREIFALADDVMGERLSAICFEGPEATLRQTRYTQPAILAHSLAALAFLEAEGFAPGIVAGHSLGEYSALVAARVLDERTALEVVKVRADLMYRAGTEWPGAMAAILGLDEAEVAQICRELEAEGVVVPANLNGPGQVVIAGEVAATERAMAMATERGAKRAIKLPVSGAFHSPLMKAASAGLSAAIDAARYSDARVPVVVNVSAEPVSAGEALRECSKTQLMSPVRWEASMRRLIEESATHVVEVGPGVVLKGLLKKIAGRFPCATFQAPDDLASLVKLFESEAVS
jgi:[acyl-carrier-protein] S-malonyltransferase